MATHNDNGNGAASKIAATAPCCSCRIASGLLLLRIVLILPSAAGDHPPSVNTTNIMLAGSKSGSGTSSLRGYDAFMCPGFVPIRGHLLAFAEGRIWTCADFGAHDLVMRRSVDDGMPATWSSLFDHEYNFA